MIDFQSSAIVKSQNHLAAISRHVRVLPAGEGRGEGESFGIEFRVAGEGELRDRGRQSTLIWTSIPALRIRVNSRNSRKKLRATPTYSNLIRSIKDPLPPPPWRR